MMLGQLKALLGIADRASQQLEYWREYKGQEIWIRSTEIERSDQKTHKQISYVIKGTVEDVMSFPPGFLLRDVEELLIESSFRLLYSPSSTEPAEVLPANEAHEVLRTVEKKFVSFDTIEQLEKGEWVDGATEPFREEFNNRVDDDQ